MERPNIKMNEPLGKYSTYRIGGPAKCLFFAADDNQIIAGLEVARENNFPFFVLGGGSNVLFSDNGFNGLILKIENSFIDPDGGDAAMRLIVGAGTPLAALSRYALDYSLTGMEWSRQCWSFPPGNERSSRRGSCS